MAEQGPEQDSARSYGMTQRRAFRWSPAMVAAFTAMAIGLIGALSTGIVNVITAARIESKVAVVAETVEKAASKDQARDVVIGDTHKLVNSRFTAALRSLVFLLKKEADRTHEPSAREAYKQAVRDLEEAEAGARAVAEGKDLATP